MNKESVLAKADRNAASWRDELIAILKAKDRNGTLEDIIPVMNQYRDEIHDILSHEWSKKAELRAITLTAAMYGLGQVIILMNEHGGDQ